MDSEMLWQDDVRYVDKIIVVQRNLFSIVVQYFPLNHSIIIFTKMLFKNLLEASNDIGDNQLLEMQKDLRAKIQKAKSLASTCKVSKQADDVAFAATSTGELIFPDFKTDINYNEQFWKTYLKNQISFAMIKELSEKTSSLQQQVKEIEGLQEQYFKLYKLKNRKKNRRLATQIEKNFTCPYEKCYKIYGSDVSLNLHIKLKHNGGNKTDRQKLAEQICIAEEKGQPLPEMRLNLPPGYLDEFRQNYFNRKENGNNDDHSNEEKMANRNNDNEQNQKRALEDDEADE